MTKYVLKLPLLIILMFALSSCGFTLRQKTAIPAPLHKIYLQSINPYGPFTTALKQTLRANNVTIVNQPNQAPYTLVISAANLTHSNPNIFSSAQASVYSFTFSVTWQINAATGKNILPAQTVTSSRDLTLNPNEVLGASNQVDTVAAEMRQEVILKILNILSAKKTAEALRAKTRH